MQLLRGALIVQKTSMRSAALVAVGPYLPLRTPMSAAAAAMPAVVLLQGLLLQLGLLRPGQQHQHLLQAPVAP